MARLRCLWCGLKFDQLPFQVNEKREYCSEKCRVAAYRHRKKGWDLIGVERSEADLVNRLRIIGYCDEHSKFYFIRKQPFGDSMSKDCWRIYVLRTKLAIFKAKQLIKNKSVTTKRKV